MTYNVCVSERMHHNLMAIARVRAPVNMFRKKKVAHYCTLVANIYGIMNMNINHKSLMMRPGDGVTLWIGHSFVWDLSYLEHYWIIFRSGFWHDESFLTYQKPAARFVFPSDIYFIWSVVVHNCKWSVTFSFIRYFVFFSCPHLHFGHKSYATNLEW